MNIADARRCSPGLYEASFTRSGAATLWLEHTGDSKRLVVTGPERELERFEGAVEPFEEGQLLKRCRLDAANATATRRTLPNLMPVPFGLSTSAGFGDRLGIATPGHARAIGRVRERHPGAEIVPIFAQQSIREMKRTQRTPLEVMDDATWGAFEAGWRERLGADADHLKSTADIDICVEAGFSFFTIDPGEHVDDEAHQAAAADLEQKVRALPWRELEDSADDMEARYLGRRLPSSRVDLAMDRESLLRAAAKYGSAIAHVAAMYRHLAGKDVPFELEVSFDETATPTSHLEHLFIAGELRRLGVEWVSLAPRYVGGFEKGIDYIGDVGELTEDLAGHAEIARELGPYKLSLHSGSDKFSVYAPIAELTGGMVHLKTAGTSYLEALRVVAGFDAGLFRRIVDYSRDRFEEDRASYHISAQLERVPEADAISDQELPALLEQPDARQVLHVTFGSVLAQFRGAIKAVLAAHEEEHYEGLARHFERHLEPFAEVIE